MADRDQKKAEQERKRLEKEVQERHAAASVELREGSYRFASKLRGQAGLILEELIDPEGESIMTLADIEGDVGALALALPLDLITFETWLLGQIGDAEELDLELPSHHELWHNFGSWVGETLRRRHGGHWMFPSDDPKSWRLGFSKIMLELAPHMFAGQLLSMGSGCARNLVSEIERLRAMHEAQREADNGQDIDRFTAHHYIRMHTMPLGQWIVMDVRHCDRMWNHAAAKDLSKELVKQSKRLGGNHSEVIQKLVEAIGKADPNRPIGEQTDDRGFFEAVSQIIALKRTAPPVAMDVLEDMVMPVMHIGIPDRFPDLDEDDLAALRKGVELFALFIEVVPHKYPADDEGFLRTIPHENLATPYKDRKNLEIGKGDWVIVDTKPFKQMLLEFDSKRMLDKYDDFVKYVKSNPKAPRRRDSGRMVAESVARALAELKACVVAASKNDQALMFRMLPPPA